jgi:hypothetical protein
VGGVMGSTVAWTNCEILEAMQKHLTNLFLFPDQLRPFIAKSDLLL